VLGKGSFGKVFLAQEKKTGAMSAVKALKKHTVIEGNDLNSCMTEKLVLALSPYPYGARFRERFTLEDVIGSYTCSLEALAWV
jgi:serine/threonine protein kinase